MKREERIKEFLEELDDDTIITLFRDATKYSGYFSYADIFDTDDIDDIFCNELPSEIIRMVVYGNVENIYDYFRVNAYGNFETVDEYELADECRDDIDEMVDWIIDNPYAIDYPDGLQEIIDEEEEE